MKSTKSIEEETLLPSSLLEDEYLDTKNIPNDESFINYTLKEKALSFEEEIKTSNFSNKNFLNSEYKEEFKGEINDYYFSHEKEEQNPKNSYLIQLNSSNELLKPEKIFSDGTKEKKWSQKNFIPIPKDKLSESNQNNKIFNGYESKVLNNKNEFHNKILKENNSNRSNSTLNNFTNNFSNINNNNFINYKNNINNIKNEEISIKNISSFFEVNKQSSKISDIPFEEQKSLIDFKNDFNNHFININIGYNNNMSNINCMNNNNKKNIFITNYNSSSSGKDTFPKSLSNLDKENVNIFNTNLNNNYLNIFNNVYKYSSFHILTPNFEEEKNSENNPNYKNNINSNNKKTESPFQSKENKEKIINEFKLFCEGLKPNLIDYICSKEGSKIIQYHLNFYKSLKIKYLIKKIFPYFQKIICDKYGNYFFQKLYIISCKKQRLKILNYIKNIFVTASKDETGVYVIQRIIEETQSEEEKKIIMENIKGNEIEMSLNKEGTHIIQKIIQIFSEKEIEDLINILCSQNNIEKLLEDSNGINVIKRMINYIKEKSNKMKLIKVLYCNIYQILKSQNGSNIIFYLLDQWGLDIGIDIINILLKNFEAFASNKYSAKLIYKILNICMNKCLLLFCYNSNNNSNINNSNEFIILNNLKKILFEPNKIINLYGNKYAKFLIGKIRSLLTSEENKIFFLFIKSLESNNFYCENKINKIYFDIFNSH